MLKILSKIFIKNYENTNDLKVRKSYGLMSGIVGMVSNILLSIIKVISGIISGSIAILADGLNNISDGASSLITFIAFKLSDTPADKKHPFGHQRIEYVGGVIVSIVIIFVGIMLASSSFSKIINPEELDFSNYYLILIILTISILIKLWLWFFYNRIGKLIKSESLFASAADSRNDVITTLAVLISLIIGFYTGWKVDGYFGMAIAIYIIISGIQLVKETVSPLLGEAPNDEFVVEIEKRIKSYEGVLGVHDLVIHSYGPAKSFITVHVEVDASIDVSISHDAIDNIELDFLNDNINLVIHMDPVDINNPNTLELKAKVEEIIVGYSSELSFHDFRIVKGTTHSNILFDLVIPSGFKISDSEIEDVITKEIKKIDKTFNVIIIFDHNYIG